MNGKAKLLTGMLLALPILSWGHLHSGPYVGVGIGSQNFSTRLHNELYLSNGLLPPTYETASIFDNKIAITGVIGDVYLGWQYYCNQFWGAIEGEYQFGSNKTHVTKFDSANRVNEFLPVGTDGVTAELNLRAQEQFSVGLLLGYEALCNVAFYVRGGYQQGQFKSNSPEGGELGYTGRFTKNLSGYQLGLGVQTELCDGFGMRLEYRYIGYNNGTTRISNSPEWTIPAVGELPERPAVSHSRYKTAQDNQMILSANYVFDLCL